MVDSLPRFDYELVKQGTGNTITFKLNDTTDSLRQKVNNYTSSTTNLKYWSFEILEWFASDFDLMDFTVYHLCLTYPDSHRYGGLVQNINLPAGFPNNTLLLCSSGIDKEMFGIPSIGSHISNGEFKFAPSQTNSQTKLTDNIILTIRDEAGNLAPATTKFKFVIKYKEYVNVMVLPPAA